MGWWGTVLISFGTAILSGIISGLFALHIDRRQQRRKDNLIRREELKKQYDERPRLELKDFKDISHGEMQSKSDCECVILNIEDISNDNGTLLFSYDERAIDKKNLCCCEYIFENTGKTEIDDICIVSTSPKTTSIINLNSREFLINYKTLSYEAWSDKRFIKPGETVSIKVCYLKDKVIGSPVGAVASIYMEDINGNLWHQPLFCPTDAMENSTRASHKEFKDSRDIRLAFKCFKNPSLW